MSSFDEIKRISPKNSIKFFLYKDIVLFIEYSLQYHRNKVYHGLKKVLIFEDEFRFSVAQQNTHIDKTDLLTLLLEIIGFISHSFYLWLLSFIQGFTLTIIVALTKMNLFQAFEFCLIFCHHSHVFVYFLNELDE